MEQNILPGMPDNMQSPSVAESGHKRDSSGRVSRVVKKKGELLTDNEKKANHIVSEQKRRQNIRTGYDQLIQIVPTLTPSQRSEALILQKTVEYIKYLLMEREILEGQVKNINM
ncbi:Transcription factor [Coemansia guatemalensis]|uniref:Transcription factor n=1 Tax=Coemansia guatemalensis TaxID=2761395 RepID=A0A9W8HMT7_9FUNG|nr:Transcription factor [Coemansia guatemalensis]